PIINGIAPKLSGGRKEIRWDARDDLRRTIGIQLEFALIAPYIARIQRDEDRYVADDLYPFLGSVGFQLAPFAIKKELPQFLSRDLAFQNTSSGIERILAANAQIFRPFVPGLVAVSRSRRSIECIVIEPERILAAKRVK